MPSEKDFIKTAKNTDFQTKSVENNNAPKVQTGKGADSISSAKSASQPSTQTTTKAPNNSVPSTASPTRTSQSPQTPPQSGGGASSRPQASMPQTSRESGTISNPTPTHGSQPSTQTTAKAPNNSVPKTAGSTFTPLKTSETGDITPQATTTKESITKASQTATSVVASMSAINANTHNAIHSFNNKPVLRSELLNAGKTLVSKAEVALSSSDDLGGQAVTGLIESGRISMYAFRASQYVTQATPSVVRTSVDGIKTGVNGVVSVGKGVYQVGKQTALSTVAIVQAYSLCKGLNVMPISKEGLNILKASTIWTGLSNTQISKAVSKGIQTAVNNIHSVVLKAKSIKTNIVITAKGIKQTAQNAYVLMKGLATGTLNVSYVAYRMEMFLKLKAGKALNAVKPFAKAGLRTTFKGAIKGTKWAVFRGMPKGIKTLKGGVVGLASLGEGIDDFAVQGAIQTVKVLDVATRVGAQTIKTGVRVGANTSVKTVKTAIKVGKGIGYWANFVKTNGWKKAMESAGKKAGKKFLTALQNSGKSIVSAVINLIKGLGTKIIIPLCLLLFVVCGGLTAITAPIAGIVSWVSGWFGTSDTNEEFEVSSFLSNNSYGVPYYASASRSLILAKCTNAKKPTGSFDLVRLYSDTTDSGIGAQININATAINNAFYTNAELIDIMSPVFNAVVYMNYDGTPTLQQAKDILADLYNRLFSFTYVDTVEYCGQSLTDGTGYAHTNHSCGYIHAESDCPNKTTGYHTTFTCGKNSSHTEYICNGHDDGTGNITYCSTTSALTSPCSNCTTRTVTVGCDYYGYKCGGYSVLNCTTPEHSHSCSECCSKYGSVHIFHNWTCGETEHTHGSGCYTTNYCNSGNEMSTACSHSPTSIFHCEGYSYCAGHGTRSYKLEMGGIYALINEIFIQPIDYYASLATRTEDEETAYQNLKDWYELFEVMLSEMSGSSYGGGISLSELNDVVWVTSPRTGNSDVVDLALSQVGNVGGETYWRYAGFTNRVAWCACFVNWCMRNTPSATGAYATTSNNYYCQTVADYYNSNGQFGHDYNNIAKGDCIFFDWECDGHTDHIGIVIGRDNEFVYTVEGNSGDAVKIKKYPLSSSVIYGYVYLNY